MARFRIEFVTPGDPWREYEIEAAVTPRDVIALARDNWIIAEEVVAGRLYPPAAVNIRHAIQIIAP